MVNSNKISEIKIILEGFLKDIDSLSKVEIISHLEWENLFAGIDMVKQKLDSMRIEQERAYVREKEQEVKELSRAIAELKHIVESTKANIPYRKNTPIVTVESISDKESISVATVGSTTDKEDTPTATIESISDREDISAATVGGTPDKEYTPTAIIESVSGKEDISATVMEGIPDIDISGPEWMLDEPGPRVYDLNEAITLNDKICFINELFKGDSEQYIFSVQHLNELSLFKDALEYVRRTFPNWDEDSSEVYRFYMVLRRRYDG